MLERVQNKFVRYLYMKLYGVYPYYQLMYPTLFVLCMVGYNELRVRRELTLVTYVVRVLRGQICNADVLRLVSLRAPDRYVWRRHRPSLLAVPNGRTVARQWRTEGGATDARTPYPQCDSREDGFILLHSE
ncbi:jg27230 [Pararge aegeria aegeria]|uniref:Jg27230 protein n=1 Tax=Pararge aegeria aegeria TaxID=348720 RepID=A0A8S4RCL9_9NEOP|nr:jg27230 [Pararge aegeria aegeria]